MNSLVYAINITTLATWLSLTGLDVVAWVMPIWHAEPQSSRSGETAAVLKIPEISLGAPEASAAAAEPAPEVPEVVPPDVVPAPPELPASADFPPLPEVPELAANSPAPTVPSAQKSPSPKPAPRREGTPSARPNAAAGGDASGHAAADRLAAGQMPPPSYPAEARSKGQSGTVLVEFMIGADGQVLSAYAKDPSPWPLLNNEAVHTVRRWKFPPGTVMKLQRPIVFQLK